MASSNASQDPSQLPEPREGPVDHSESTIPDSPPTPDSLRPLNIRTRAKRVSTTVFEQVLRNQQRKSLSSTEQMSSVPSEPATPEGMSLLEIRRKRIQVPVDTFIRALQDTQGSDSHVPSEPATPEGMSLLQVGRKKVKVSTDTFLKALQVSEDSAVLDDSVFREEDARSNLTVNLTTAGSLVPSRPVSRKEQLLESLSVESITETTNSDEVVERLKKSLEVPTPSPLGAVKEVSRVSAEKPATHEEDPEETEMSIPSLDEDDKSERGEGARKEPDSAIATEDGSSRVENAVTEGKGSKKDENGENQRKTQLLTNKQEAEGKKDPSEKNDEYLTEDEEDTVPSITEDEASKPEEQLTKKQDNLKRTGEKEEEGKDRKTDDAEKEVETDQGAKAREEATVRSEDPKKREEMKPDTKVSNENGKDAQTQVIKPAEHKTSTRAQHVAIASTPARSTAASRLVSTDSFNLSPIPAASVSTFRGHIHETRQEDSVDEDSAEDEDDDVDEEEDNENYETAEEEEKEEKFIDPERPTPNPAAKSVSTNPAKGKTLAPDVEAHLELLRRACAISNSRPPPPVKLEPLSERMKNYPPEKRKAAEALQRKMDRWVREEEPSPVSAEPPKKKLMKKPAGIAQKPKKPKLADNIASLAVNRTNFNFYSRLTLTKEAAVEVHKMVDDYTDAILEATANYCEEKGLSGVDKPDDFLAIMKRMGLVEHEHDYASMVHSLMWDDYRKFLLPVGLPANIVPPKKKKK